MDEYGDFEEIAHCGGQAIFQIASDAEGRKAYSVGFRHSRPAPATVIGIYAFAPNGQVVGDFRIGGIGQVFDPQCPQGCFPVFLGSDSRSCWGHQCPRCSGYFRNGIHPAIYPLTCPYCGLRAAAHVFLTPAQRLYVQHYVNTLLEGLDQDIEPNCNRELVIDMDAVLGAGSYEPRPAFYYAAESQQTRYKCHKCGEFNDIRGRFGYCASCGWRNNVPALKEFMGNLRQKLNDSQVSPVEALRSAVSEFDSCCRDIASHIRKRIPMKPSRKDLLERTMFHDLESDAVTIMKAMFDVDLLRGMEGEIAFLKMMMHRRHAFEHSGGVADDRYVKLSGDPDARIGVLIRESRENAHRLLSGLTRIAENLDSDFHQIFPPTTCPIEHYQRQRRMQRRSGTK